MNYQNRFLALFILSLGSYIAQGQIVTSEIEVIGDSSTIIREDLEVQGKLQVHSSVSLNKSYHGKAFVRMNTPNTSSYPVNLSSLFPDINFDDGGKLWVFVQLVAEKSGGGPYRQGGYQQSFLRNHHKGWNSSGPYAVTSWDGVNYPYNLRGDGDTLHVEIGGGNLNFAMTIEVTKL